MLARGASEAGTANGANAIACGAYSAARCAADARRNCALTRVPARAPAARAQADQPAADEADGAIDQRKRASAGENDMNPRNSG